MQELEAIVPVDTSAVTSVKLELFAPFGIFRTLSEALFETLTQEDGEKYNKQISDLLKGQTD